MVMVRGVPPGVVGGVSGSVEVAVLDAGGSVGDASDDRTPDEVRVGSGSALSVDDVHPASATAAANAPSHRSLPGGRRPDEPRSEDAGRFSSVMGVKHRIRGASVARRLRPGR